MVSVSGLFANSIKIYVLFLFIIIIKQLPKNLSESVMKEV